MPEHLILQAWRTHFGDALPTGSSCRRALPDRWLRIHSLPQSKRYPETTDEVRELLMRQNTVATDVLGEASDCVLFITRFGDEPDCEDLPLVGQTPELVLSVAEDGDAISFFALPVTWRRGAFDDLILACARDRTGQILFADLAHGGACAPYDGGADLFFRSHEDALMARTRHRAWLSARPDGR